MIDRKKYNTAITIGLDQLDNMDRVKSALELKLQLGDGKSIYMPKSEAEKLIDFIQMVTDNLEKSYTDLADIKEPISSDKIPQIMIKTLLQKLEESESRRAVA